MVLETLLALTNAEMTDSCSIHKDLLVELKMLQRLTDCKRSCINQRKRCVFFNQLSLRYYLLKRRTLFIIINNNNNLTSSNKTNSSTSTIRIMQLTRRQMTSTNMMTNIGTLLMTILIIDLAIQNYYSQSALIFCIVFLFYICFQFNFMIYFSLCFGFINFTIS